MAKDNNNNVIIAAVVAIVAIAGLIINFANLPTGAAFGSDPWVRSTTPTGLDPAFYDLGEDVARACIAELTRTGAPYTQEVTGSDWQLCPVYQCADACEALGSPDGCVDMCRSGATRYIRKSLELFPTSG